MKFVYVDESGDQSQSDVFVMAGLLIDAYRLRKYTAVFDEMIKAFLEKHPKAPKELKTKALINGSKKWGQIDPKERKKFVEDVCKLATECARIFAIAVSFEEFAKAAKAGHRQPFGNDYWLGAGMFLSSLLQKKVQGTANNKGLTVLIFDDNQAEMPKLSDGLYQADPWFDPTYQTSKKDKGKTVWNEIPEGKRFDHIINSAFAIKSHHSSLIQVAGFSLALSLLSKWAKKRDKEGQLLWWCEWEHDFYPPAEACEWARPILATAAVFARASTEDAHIEPTLQIGRDA